MDEIAKLIEFFPIIVVIFTIILVLIAKNRPPAALPQPKPLPQQPPPPPTNKWLEESYRAARSLFAETDRAMWQIVAIFLPVSLLIMGWVVKNINDLSRDMILILGSASILLVGVATLFKYRLRSFNILHIRYLERLEKAFMGGQNVADYWGLHHVRRQLEAQGLSKLISIHRVINTYFFLFIGIWIYLWFITNHQVGLR